MPATRGNDSSPWLSKVITREEIQDRQLVLCKEDVEKYIYAHAPHIVQDVVEGKGKMLCVKMKTHSCWGEVKYSFSGSGTFLRKEIEDMYILGWESVVEMYSPCEGNYIYLKYATAPGDKVEVFEFFISEDPPYMRRMQRLIESTIN